VKLSLHHILWTKDPNPRGLFPIYLRITIDRKSTHISSGDFISERQWDRKEEQVRNHPLENDINARLRALKAKASNKFNERILAGKKISAKELKAVFTGGADMHNLFDFADLFLKEVEHKRSAKTIVNYKRHLARFEDYNRGRQLFFEDIDQEWLTNYESFLRSGSLVGKHKKNLSNNYIHAFFKTLKLLFNAAIKRGVIADYPFNRYENPIYVAPVKDYLTLEEIGKIEEFADTTEENMLKQVAVYLLLGISTGLRISDWKQFDMSKSIKGDRLLLRAKKNGEWVSMPINDLLRRNLKRIEQTPLDLSENKVNVKLKQLATKIGIKKTITSHTGRHTFATTLCADRGISSETCAELMGININTCVENYYRVSNRKIDSETVRAWEGL
jgi:site-specific recombinase XerD